LLGSLSQTLETPCTSHLPFNSLCWVPRPCSRSTY